MLSDFYATKLRMTQVWTAEGKRMPVTVVKADDMRVVTVSTVKVTDSTVDSRPMKNSQLIEVAFGTKKLKNMSKPLRVKTTKSGFSVGSAKIKGLHVAADAEIKAGATISFSDVLEVGDVVQVQGTSKGKGFAGGMKRHGFKGGPKTHGQSDRARAVGSIGMGTTPGRVFKGKKMPGHMGDVTSTVTGLVVIHVDPTTNEVWLSGPIPGSVNSFVKVRKTGKTKAIELDMAASDITVVEPEAEPTTEKVEEAPAEKTEEAA